MRLLPTILLASVVAAAAAPVVPADVAAARAERLAKLTAPDGWLTLIGLHFLPDGESTVGRDRGNRIVLAAGPARIGRVIPNGARKIALVIESGVPITMIPLDATNQVPLTEDFITNFKQNTQGDVADYIANAWEDALKNPLGEYYHWDPLAAAIAVNPDLITRFGHARVKVNAQVEREKKPADVPFGAGKSFDRLSWLGDARRSLDAMKSGWTKRDRSGERIDIVFSPDVKGFETEMITTFQRQTNELDTMTLPPFALPPCP